MDEFKEGRTKEEEIAKEGAMDDDGFQLVCRKNNKKSAKEESVPGSSYSATGVSVATKDRRISGAKPKVPFHIPSIPRPQDEYRIIVNNANLPFQHVWLEQSEDGTRLIHPLVDLSLSLTHECTLCVFIYLALVWAFKNGLIYNIECSLFRRRRQLWILSIEKVTYVSL